MTAGSRIAARTAALPIAAVMTIAIARPSSADSLTQPFRARNLSPPIAIFGVPSWDEGLSAQQRQRLTLSGELASHFRFVTAGSESLILDGETWRADLTYQRFVSDAWTLGVELPVVRLSGGVLDDPIDAWHSFFNLPDGRRNERPEDELQIYYSDGAQPAYFRRRAENGLGDMQLSAARRFGADDDWLVELTVKLPTGDEDLLAGSGSTDVAVSVLRSGRTRWRARAAGWFWGAGLMRVGEAKRLPARSRDWVALGMIGASWQPFPRLGFKLQLDLHSAFYDSALEELGDPAMQATLGGWWTLDARRTLSIAVIEDLVVRAAPDVSLQIAFAWTL